MKGWDTALQQELDAFLQDCSKQAGPTYLQAAMFKLQHSMEAWKHACRSKHNRQPAAAAATEAAAAAADAAAEAAGGRASRAPPAAPAAAPEAAGLMAHLTPGQAAGIPYAVSIWLTVHDLIARGCLSPASAPDKDLGKAAAKQCEQAMLLLGFAQAAASISDGLRAFASKKDKGSKAKAAAAAEPAAAAAPASESLSTLDNNATLRPGKAATSSRKGAFGVGVSEAVFQLQFCGDLLPRAAPAEPDPRVVTFNPDFWQRQVLDAIDAGASSVICAPTSSGKTFISSYCMDRVLNSLQDKEGVVVFVAPTKALVNQTAAEVLCSSMHCSWCATAACSPAAQARSCRESLQKLMGCVLNMS